MGLLAPFTCTPISHAALAHCELIALTSHLGICSPSTASLPIVVGVVISISSTSCTPESETFAPKHCTQEEEAARGDRVDQEYAGVAVECQFNVGCGRRGWGDAEMGGTSSGPDGVTGATAAADGGHGHGSEQEKGIEDGMRDGNVVEGTKERSDIGRGQDSSPSISGTGPRVIKGEDNDVDMAPPTPSLTSISPTIGSPTSTLSFNEVV
ncbi:hypothetical protein CPB84DRAFT_140724 [Gymnopilus junonius]|uniref:Uncharacterized protein n=1 Tax=Gymnopilus junonius TaxID=109634 RepID=A0A9P5N7Z4_GYMJU|nr:hypothetical protein CPB84DRAFT_140724 [Gymnopilus junonius]